MVLESLVTPFKAEKSPWEMFFVGILYATVALFISIQIFEKMAGLIAVFLTVMACLPVTFNAIKLEEQKDTLNLSQRDILREHGRALSFFMFLFLGVMVAFTMWYLFLPPEVINELFAVQIDTIRSINSNSMSGAVPSLGIFSVIFLNNIKVLIFCVLFAFFYGAGMIFILTWNASVIAVAIGAFVRSGLADYAGVFGTQKFLAYFHVFALGMLRYMIHGIPEIVSYFIGGMAGGIISVAVVKHDFRTKHFEKIALDAANLVVLSIVILFLAAVIEVYLTPVLF
jgi:uncharacterized membrane protein SpoIIM required for sporulation